MNALFVRISLVLGICAALAGLATVVFAEGGNGQCKTEMIYHQVAGSWSFQGIDCAGICPVNGEGRPGQCIAVQVGSYFDPQAGHRMAQATCGCVYDRGEENETTQVDTIGGTMACGGLLTVDTVTQAGSAGCTGDCPAGGPPICKVTNITLYTDNGVSKKKEVCGCAEGN